MNRDRALIEPSPICLVDPRRALAGQRQANLCQRLGMVREGLEDRAAPGKFQGLTIVPGNTFTEQAAAGSVDQRQDHRRALRHETKISVRCHLPAYVLKLNEKAPFGIVTRNDYTCSQNVDQRPVRAYEPYVILPAALPGSQALHRLCYLRVPIVRMDQRLPRDIDELGLIATKDPAGGRIHPAHPAAVKIEDREPYLHPVEKVHPQSPLNPRIPAHHHRSSRSAIGSLRGFL
nr:hypothetical protein [Frankia sp. R43]